MQQTYDEQFDPRLLLGKLIERVDNLCGEVEEHKQRSEKEHRLVHDIVVAQSESVRIITRDIAEIKPIVKQYELKAQHIDETMVIAKAYNIEKLQREGATKLVRTLWVIIVALGGLIGAIVYNATVNWLHMVDKIPH